MPVVRIELRGAEEFARICEHAPAYVAKNSGPLLEEHGDRVIAWMRSRSARFAFKEGRGAFLNDTWRDKAKVRKNGASVIAGWGGPGASYGYVLERGPAIKKQWKIEPKNTLTQSYTTKGGKKRNVGDPILALRMIIGQKVVYRKSVQRTWQRKSLRPHWWPALIANDRKFVDEWSDVLRRAFRVV